MSVEKGAFKEFYYEPACYYPFRNSVMDIDVDTAPQRVLKLPKICYGNL
jgi:hypothetical protein